MIEIVGDLFATEADATVITTNLTVTARHKAVMGRGVALQARDAFPGIDLRLGTHITLHGSAVGVIWQIAVAGYHGPKAPAGVAVNRLVAYPVKMHYRDKGDVKLIVQSAERLVRLTDREGWERVAMPRPGCGSGRLSWEHVVKPLLAARLDDRFVIVERDA